MQITEASLFGLRTAIMEMKSVKSQLTFILIPMIHSAEKEFYDQVAQKVRESDYSIQEGVKESDGDLSFEGDLETPYYDDESLNRFGLISQPDFSMKGVKILNFDSSNTHVMEKFEKRDERPLWMKALLFFVLGIGFFGRILVKIFKALQRLSLYLLKSRKMLAKYLVVDTTLKTYQDEGTQDFVDVLLDRDTNLHANLRDFIKNKGDQKLTVTVVYGAAHIPGIHQVLNEEGFVITNADWVQVFAA